MGRFIDQTYLLGFVTKANLDKVNAENIGAIDAMLPAIESEFVSFARQRFPIVDQRVTLVVDDAIKGKIATIWAYRISLRFLNFVPTGAEGSIEEFKLEYERALRYFEQIGRGEVTPVIEAADGADPSSLHDENPSLDTKAAHVRHGHSRWGRR